MPDSSLTYPKSSILEAYSFRIGSTLSARRIPASSISSKLSEFPTITISAFAKVSIALIVVICKLALVSKKMMQPSVSA